MIDWDKLGPANSPTPSTPDTTAPVAPASPGSMNVSAGAFPTPGVPQTGAPVGTYQTGQGWRPASQQQVDEMDPFERMGRGIDYLGYLLFGNKEGENYGHQAPLAGLPVVPEALKAAGDFLHTGADITVVQPFEAGAGAIARVPLGWLPGGADESFNRIGEWAKTNDPAVYQQWLLVNSAANADILYGGNLKADFNMEVAQYLDDQMYESKLGHTPELALGREAIGSLGGALSHAITGWLGVTGNLSQRLLGGAGVFDPGGNRASYEDQYRAYKSPGARDASGHSIGIGDEQKVIFQQLDEGKITEAEARAAVAEVSKGGRNRVVESAARLDAGLEVSDVERHAVEAWRSGAWSLDHAQDWIVSHGQGITRNFVGQLGGSLVTDPLTYATIGAGSIAKAGQVGAKVATVAGKGATLAERMAVATSAYEKFGVTVNAVQRLQVAGHELGPAFRLSRGMFDPFAVYKPSTVQRAVTDLRNGVALVSFERAYGRFTVRDLRALSREFGIENEIDSAIASYSIDQANLMIAMKAQRDLLEQGLGESMVHTAVDDVIDPMARQAGRDAITELTDHMLSTSKNIFTDEDLVTLAGRVASVYGNDVPYWTKRLSTMSDDLKRALHAVTYKRPEVDFEEARAMVVADNYHGELPLGQLVLMTDDTLDDVIAKDIIENIRAVLKDEQTEERIAAATAEWNAQAMRYPAMQTIGYATGGQQQVETLVKELEKQVEAGAITKRAGVSELADPALKPIRDVLDRYTMPSDQPMSAADIVGRQKLRSADAAYAVHQAGFVEVSAAKFFPAIRKATKVVKSNGRTVGETVYVYSKGEYGKMRLFLHADGKTGFAIKPDGDLVSVFNVGDKGRIQQVIPHLHDLGATKLDAFDEAGRLPELYGRGGFKEVRREPWNPQYAPPGWTGGTPDVVYMEHPGRVPGEAPLYHGSPNKDLLSASAAPETRQFDNATSQFGVFMTPARREAEKYAGTTGKVYEAGKRPQNPYQMSRQEFDYFQSPEKDAAGKRVPAERWGERAEELKAEAIAKRAELEAQGYDGIAVPGNRGNAPEIASFSDVPLLAEEMGSKPLWKVGFRPSEDVAWGLKRSDETGRYMVDRAPTISHVVDAVPGRQHFSDTTRNVLGQIIGPSKAERLNRPIDSIEAFINTQRDVVTGRRLVMNIERRFEVGMNDIGVPRTITREIFAKARDVAGLDYTTVRGIKPDNLWNAIHDIIPRDLILKNGDRINVHIVMDQLLQAAEGDLRIMGVTSVLSQRMRNALRKAGLDPANWAGQMTVTMYNKLRYSQPIFLIQRITDAPYYSILYGVRPVGRGTLDEGNQAVRTITDNLGVTGLARYFSMDMPEYATRSNFTAGIKSAMQQMGLKENKLQRVLEMPDTIIANNMTNMLHARLGDIVRGSLDNLSAAAARDPELAAEMLQAGEVLTRSFDDWAAVYSQNAGRILSDSEVGLMYIQDMLNAWRRHVVNADGTLDFKRLIHEGDMFTPSDIGQLAPIKPDLLAQELGYVDSTALRRDVVGHIEKINGEFVLVRGEHDLPWLAEQLRTTLRANPDYQKRVMAYYSETWDDFWHRMSLDLDKGGLDISPHYAKEAQEVIAKLAQDRGMDPWEYLSGVMSVNIGPDQLDTAIGRFVNFLKGGTNKAAPGDWGAFFRSHLDPSAQQTLVDDWIRQNGGVVPKAAPAGFNTNPNVAASGFTFPPEIKREGLFHVTSRKDAVMAEGFKSGSVAEGFGSAGDATLQGRVSFLTDRARAQTYMDRMLIAVKAARGEADPAAILAYFEPVYAKGWGDRARAEMENVMGMAFGDVYNAFPTPELRYKLVQQLDAGLIGGNLAAQDRIVKLTGPFASVSQIEPKQIAMLDLATKDRANILKGVDTAELTIKPEDVVPLGTGAINTSKFFDEGIIDMLKARAAAGANANPDVEAVLQQVAKLVQTTLKGEGDLAGTRNTMRDLVQAIPTNNAAPFNRSQALVVALLKQKIEDAQQDVFRLAEMQTKRSVLERSLNHPLFGLYPASYMWGKVLPETAKFLAKNPYAMTYTIARVQRSIAIQREYDRELDDKVGAVDRSAGAFLLDYLTPGLPWSDHSARMSPMFRGILNGKDPGWIWDAELSTVSPQRWVRQVVETMDEVPGAMDSMLSSPTEEPAWQQGLQSIAGGASAPASGPGEPTQITGPTKASALAPILQDDLSRLQSILLEGASPEE